MPSSDRLNPCYRTELRQVSGAVLGAIAEQFDSPIAEYWYHPENTVYVGMMSWQGHVFDREEIVKRYPTHSGVTGLKLPPDQFYGESLQCRKQYFIREDWFAAPFVRDLTWYSEHGLLKEINVPMVLGDNCIGALIVRMAPEQQYHDASGNAGCPTNAVGRRGETSRSGTRCGTSKG